MTGKRDTREMERCFLGSLLLAAGNGKIETRLKSDDFESNHYGRIYETILNQWREGITPTIATLCYALSANKDDKNYVPPATIAETTTSIPSEANIHFYENVIFEASKTRLFIRALQTAQEEIDRHTDTDTVIKNLLPSLAAVTTARNEAGIKSAAELLETDFPEMHWIVPGLIGEGLTLICGAPKIGKSWLAFNLAIAAASGGVFLGKLSAVKTDVLYIALEDKGRRLKSRLKRLKSPKAHNLKTTTQWQDGYIGLGYYLKANSGIGLVIIDTLAIFANIEDMNDYTMTTNAMTQLKRIADDLNIAIILIHHTKKTGQRSSGADWMESALGSTGLTGATDSSIFITRARTQKETKNTAKLYATGRDIADVMYNLKLDLDCGGWTITDKPKTNPSPPEPGNEGNPNYGL